jgi:hypothetical protein
MVLCVRWHLKVRKLRNPEAGRWRVGTGVERGEGEWPGASVVSTSSFFRGKSSLCKVKFSCHKEEALIES